MRIQEIGKGLPTCIKYILPSKNEIESATEGAGGGKEKGPSTVGGLHGQITLRDQVAEVGDGLELAGEDIGRRKGLQEEDIQKRLGPAQSLVVGVWRHDGMAGEPAIGSNHLGVESGDLRGNFHGKGMSPSSVDQLAQRLRA